MTWVWVAIVLWIAVIAAVQTGLIGWPGGRGELVSPDAWLDMAATTASEPIGPYGWCEDYVRPDWVREYEETRS